MTRVEMPGGEASEDFRQLISQPRAYHSICVHNNQQLRLGDSALDLVNSARVDDGRFELVLTVAGTRKDYRKAISQLKETGAQPVSATLDSKCCFASVTSLTV